MKKIFSAKVLFLFITFILLSSCESIINMFSDGTEEFNQVMRYVKQKEDDVAKCLTINNVEHLNMAIDALKKFNEKYSRSKHKSDVERKIHDLDRRVYDVKNMYKNLTQNLSASMENAVTGTAKKQHLFSNIISMKKINEKKQDNNNCTTLYINTYHVSMQGAFLGINTYDLEIEAIGVIDYRSGRSYISEINIISDIQNS